MKIGKAATNQLKMKPRIKIGKVASRKIMYAIFNLLFFNRISTLYLFKFCSNEKSSAFIIPTAKSTFQNITE